MYKIKYMNIYIYDPALPGSTPQWVRVSRGKGHPRPPYTHTPYQFFGPVWGMKISLTTILYNHIMPNQGISMGELLDF